MLCFVFFNFTSFKLKKNVKLAISFDLRMIRIGILFTLISVALQPGSVNCMITCEKV